MNQKINSIKIFLLCPIPDEQKPMNEYIHLKKYIKHPANYFQNSVAPSQKIKNNEQSNTSVFYSVKNELSQFIINLFLLLRWKEIEKRFNLPTILYEEGSWYDSQVWEKPFSMIKNDRLINSQTIKPVLKKNVLFFIFFLFFIVFKFFFDSFFSK